MKIIKRNGSEMPFDIEKIVMDNRHVVEAGKSFPENGDCIGIAVNTNQPSAAGKRFGNLPAMTAAACRAVNIDAAGSDIQCVDTLLQKNAFMRKIHTALL